MERMKSILEEVGAWLGAGFVMFALIEFFSLVL